MGITIPKGFRYPEPTTEARTVHTRIKELADDLTNAFTAQDNRFNQADSDVPNTQYVVGRYGNSAGVLTHSPNDSLNRTINIHTDQFYIPTNAKTAYVAIGNTATGAASSACTWQPLVSFVTGGGVYQSLGAVVSHNQGQPAVDMGFFVSSYFDVRGYGGNYGTVAINCANDATSGGWVHNGYMHWSVTLMS